jgi:Uma2 family endonuclease
MTSNQRIATADGLYTYADGSVYCGELATGPDQTATNPVLLIEVLSDSTRDYDLGEKLDRYKAVPSLRHVLLVEQHRVQVEHWSRGPDGWSRDVHVDRDDTLRLAGLGIELPLTEIYDGMERFPV